MAEDKKVATKKTAARPAATTKTSPVKAAADPGNAPLAPTTITKKAATRAAAPRPTSVPAASTSKAAPAPRPAVTAPANPGPSPVVAKKVPARKVAATNGATAGAPSTGAPSHQPSLKEKPAAPRNPATVTPEERLSMISEAAYYKAEQRGFAPGNEAEDWAAAEREIDAFIAKTKTP